MAHDAYIQMSDPENARQVSKAATEMFGESYIGTQGSPAQPASPNEAELAFHIEDADTPEDAMARAKEMYDRSRESAGLPPDTNARPSAGHLPGSPS